MKFVSNFDPLSAVKKLAVEKIQIDLKSFTKNQKKIFKNLINCSKILNEIYLIQKYPANLKIKEKIIELNDKNILHFFNLMKGPFDVFNDNKSYISGYNKSDKAGFYPNDLAKEEFDDFLSKNDEFKEDFISPYTVIKRKKNQLVSIPYSDAYKNYLMKAADYINEIIDLIENESLKKYLKSQSEAFINNDYDKALIDWLQIKNNKIVCLLGPYECYDDKYLGYKSSYSAFIGVKNDEYNDKINMFLELIDVIQDKFPIPHHYIKRTNIPHSSIEVIDLIYFDADARSPIPTTAFNLPNSEKIRTEYGSKKIILYNILFSKYNSVFTSIAKIILNENDFNKLNFDSFINFIFFHEISHELGIGLIEDDNGEKREPVYFLKNLYAIIEEAKADVMSIFSLIYFTKQGLISDSSFSNICLTYLINLIRLLRFGSDNAHGLASHIQLVYLINENVFIMENESSHIMIDFHKFEKSIEKLLTIILTLIGESDYNKTEEFIKNYSSVEGYFKKYLDMIENIQIDILPWFPDAEEKIFD